MFCWFFGEYLDSESAEAVGFLTAEALILGVHPYLKFLHLCVEESLVSSIVSVAKR